jgi:hypothetical protein
MPASQVDRGLLSGDRPRRRDGDPAEAWLFWGAEDFARAPRRIETEVEPSARPASASG